MAKGLAACTCRGQPSTIESPKHHWDASCSRVASGSDSMPSRVHPLLFALLALATLLVEPLSLAVDDGIDAALAAISRAGPGASGSIEARRAADLLTTQDATVLPRLLAAMQTSNPVAANWLRTAYEQVVARELARPEPRFPLVELKAFVK